MSKRDAYSRRHLLVASGMGLTVALAGCTGDGDDSGQGGDDDADPEGSDSNGDQEAESDSDGAQEEDVEPDYLEQGTPEIANWNIETQYSEPIDLVEAELTLDQLEISYDILNADAVNENPEESDQYETDLETTTELILDQPHLEQPQNKETTTNNVRENYTQNELENGIRETTEIPLPDDIRNYHVETTVREDGEETQHTEQLNFADLYTEARYQHQFANPDDRFLSEAELDHVEVTDNIVELEYTTENEISERDVEREIAAITGDLTDTIQLTETPYGIDLEVEDSNGRKHSAYADKDLAVGYMDSNGLSDSKSRDLSEELWDELFP